MTTPQRQELLSTAAELASRLGQPDSRIIDCRFDLFDAEAGERAYLEGHIPGSVYAHLDRDLAGPVGPADGRHPLPDVAVAAATFQRLGVRDGVHVTVYDAAGGAIAARAWWLLRWLGHDRVTVLDGGLHAWAAAGLPLEAGGSNVEPGDFSPNARAGSVLTTAELGTAGVAIASLRLVDARSAPRFRGEQEPIDRVAGHIPGARNLPYDRCLAADGTWLPTPELRRLLREVLNDAPEAPWAVMCGSGVTACHLAISGLLAGFPEPRLYVGSWSEWIRDPRRPVAAAARGRW